MLFLLPHFLSCLTLFICVSCQLFENPNSNSIITCGLIESCQIICNQANSCESSEFYLYSNDAYIECSGQSSCKSLKIFSINTTSLTLYLNGTNAFLYGIAHIQQSNSNITTHCLNQQSCEEASFYYNGVGQNVKHYCKNIGSCNGGLISALPIDVIYIECDACNNMDIYTPISNTDISIINIISNILSTHIYSIHGLTNLNIICNGNCTNNVINDMYIIYGINYQSYCAIYDISCMQSININTIGYQQNDNIDIKYRFDGDYNRLILNNQNILLFILPSQGINHTSNIVQPSQSSSYIHVVCVDNIHYPSCNNIQFNFSLTNHAILTANNAQSITIIGPTNDYKRIAYRNNNNNNIYHLQSTPNILLQCNQLKAGNCLNNSLLYTGSTTNVTVLCGANDCHYSTIHSNLNPQFQSLSNIGFNIICYPSNTSCTPLFHLNFANTIICNTPYDPNCINFLSSSPTIYPTISPITSSPSISPSHNPSITPTISPSFNPTYTPTKTPSLNPTYNPSITPTNNPSQYPTNFPTYPPSKIPTSFPSISPTYIPTIAPTFTPTNIPTISPSQQPTAAPTIAPVISPTLSPLQPPSNAPTFTPTQTPTNEPTQPPTNAPTDSPTDYPTSAPTQPPTNAPTYSPTRTPTHSPTNHPTSDIYEHVLKVDYIISNLTYEYFIDLHNATTKQELEDLLSQSYLLYSYKIIDDPTQYLHYKYFHLQIMNVLPPLITQTKNENWFNYSATLQTDIRYLNASIGNDIHFITRMVGFENDTQNKLREYFGYYSLLLDISNPVPVGNDIRRIGEVSGFLILIISISGICILVSITSFIYNNWIPNAVTDNGNSFAILLLGLQIIDFFSDINLCVEMFTLFQGNIHNDHTTSLYIAAWGTLTFSIVPYSTNLVMATNIKNIKEIKHNPFARSYFQTTSWFFIVLTVFCGGVYPSLSIVSSRLFGFEFLNSGLTMMELTKLTKVRFFTTILLENIPQLCCSILYINYLGTVSSNTILSIVMSVLQITSCNLNYIIVRRPTDCRVIQYDLEMKIGTQFIKNKEGIKASLSSMDFNDDESDSDDATINSSQLEMGPGPGPQDVPTPSTLNMQQKQLIRSKKERKHSFRRWLCTELSLRLNAIEIGYITLTPNGCIIHIIHYLFEEEAKTFRDLRHKKRNGINISPQMQIPPISTQIGNSNTTEIELENIKETEVTGTSCEHIALKSCKSLSYDHLILAKSRSYERWDGDKKSFEKTAKSLFKHLYKTNGDRVNCAFASHFGFDQQMVSVTYHKNYTYSDWEVMNKRNFSYQNLDAIYESDNEIGKFSGQNIPDKKRKTMEHNIGDIDGNIEVKMSRDISNRGTYEESKSCASQTPTEEMKVGLSKMEELSKIIIEKLDEKDEEQVKNELLEEGYDANLIDKIMLIGKYMSSMRINSMRYDSDNSEDKIDDKEEIVSDQDENVLLNKSENVPLNIQVDKSEQMSDLDVVENHKSEQLGDLDNECDKSDECDNSVSINIMEDKQEIEENMNDDNVSSVSKGNDNDMIEKEILQLSDDDEDIDNVNENKIVENNEINEIVNDNSDSDKKEEKENIEENIIDSDSVNDNNDNEEIIRHVDENVSEENINDNNVINTDMNEQHPS